MHVSTVLHARATTCCIPAALTAVRANPKRVQRRCLLTTTKFENEAHPAPSYWLQPSLPFVTPVHRGARGIIGEGYGIGERERGHRTSSCGVLHLDLQFLTLKVDKEPAQVAGPSALSPDEHDRRPHLSPTQIRRVAG